MLHLHQQKERQGTLMTIIVCINASGHFVPPMIIFPRKNMNKQLVRGAAVSTIGVARPCGWVQGNLFTQRLQHFWRI
jgi:hypothetical protein